MITKKAVQNFCIRLTAWSDLKGWLTNGFAESCIPDAAKYKAV
jgi:hypothetical protein